jgi:hypothetical protein
MEVKMGKASQKRNDIIHKKDFWNASFLRFLDILIGIGFLLKD